MNAQLANILKAQIEGLPFIERLGGLVRTLTISEDVEGTKKRKTFPIDCSVSADDCVRGKYQDLIPNDAKRSVLYFEEIGPVQDIGRNRENYMFRSQLRLVGWLNLKKMGFTDCTWSGKAVLQILSRLPRKPFNSGDLLRIKITSVAEVEKQAANIFGKYTYDEAINQYLLYPFDYFALNISTDFEVNPACIDEIAMQDELCITETTGNT